MNRIIGIDSIVLVREARNAVRRALAFSSSVAGFRPRTFCWLGQISTQTLKIMMVPSQAPTPIALPFGPAVPTAPNVKAPSSHPMRARYAAPDSQVTTAAQRNHSRARGATYLEMAAPPG